MDSISRRSRRSTNTWPGFVDVLATILMVIIFLLMIFVIAQFFLNEAISGRDKALESLEGQVSELADLLELERHATSDLRDNVEQLSRELQVSVSSQDDMRSNIRALTTQSEVAEDQARSLTSLLETARADSTAQRLEITALADQAAALEALREKLESRVTVLLQQNDEMTGTLTIRDAFIEDQIQELAAIVQEVKALNALKIEMERRISELADLLGLERRATSDLRDNVAKLSRELRASVSSQDDMRSNIRALTTRSEVAEDQARSLTSLLETTRADSAAQRLEIATLADQAAALEALREKLESRVTALLQQNDEMTGTLTIRDAFIDDQIQELAAIVQEVKALNALKIEMERKISELAGKVEQGEGNLLTEKELSTSARAEVALLTQQTEALREQLRQISLALNISEAVNEEQGVQIRNLGQRLNAALATKVHELSQYRSEFFGRLREILGKTKDIKIVGDRFVLQSELLFEQGSADLGIAGQRQMAHLADTLREIAGKIPGDIDWVLRVDGHTDSVPIQTPHFPSNWELSAARAISVVQFLIEAGLPANRLAATAFGEYQPLSNLLTPEAMQSNRRIELKLTER